jgi:transaldolase
MKIFIDSALLHEIQDAYSFGILDGVTTNPSLLKQAVTDLQQKNQKISLENYIEQILLTAKNTPVSLEVTDYNYGQMVSQAKALYKRFNHIANNVNIKIPVNTTFPEESGSEFEGLKAIKTLHKAKIPTNCTLIFTPEQALLAAKAGAAYVSPFAGRIDDYLRKQQDISFKKTDYYPQEGMFSKDTIIQDNGIISGVDLVAQIIDLFDIYQFKTEVIAASLRNTRQVREVALAGADIATIPFSVIKELLTHYKTKEGMQKFTDDVVPEYEQLTRD